MTPLSLTEIRSGTNGQTKCHLETGFMGHMRQKLSFLAIVTGLPANSSTSNQQGDSLDFDVPAGK